MKHKINTKPIKKSKKCFDKVNKDLDILNEIIKSLLLKLQNNPI